MSESNLSQEQEQLMNEFGFKPNLLIKKREDYIDWDEYFLAVSILSAQRSKDPSTQVKKFFFFSKRLSLIHEMSMFLLQNVRKFETS